MIIRSLFLSCISFMSATSRIFGNTFPRNVKSSRSWLEDIEQLVTCLRDGSWREKKKSNRPV
jgi:hypothetical protein